jgi:hypothetical protein
LANIPRVDHRLASDINKTVCSNGRLVEAGRRPQHRNNALADD